jgi:ABC-2 type transport system ATP-binding protein
VSTSPVDEAPAVETAGLGKRFGRRTALQDLDLRVQRGSIFGFLGPNGAGKTTTIKLLVGLYRPTQGRAVVLGQDVTTHRDAVQARVGYLPGDFTGYADHTGTRFLTLLAELRGGVDQRWVDELAERLDVDLGQRMGTLSHGNVQKVGLIQAFMHHPELLVLDEPTSGLDPIMQQVFLDLLREASGRGQTVFLSSHVLSEVSAVADTVGLLDRGRLLDCLEMSEVRDLGTRIDLTFGDQVPAAAIRQVDGLRELKVDGLTAQVRVAGPVAGLLRAVAPYDVEELRTHETDLAEIFLGYYGKEANGAHRLPQGALGPAQGPAGVG